MQLQFLRTIKFPRFTMVAGEVWDCYEEWGDGKDYLDAVAKGEDRFSFAGGYCFVQDVKATSDKGDLMSWHEESKTEERIVYRCDLGRGEAWYVSSLPTGGDPDYGYDDKVEKAIPLSPYWQRRFRKEMERCNHKPHFLHVAAAKGEPL